MLDNSLSFSLAEGTCREIKSQRDRRRTLRQRDGAMSMRRWQGGKIKRRNGNGTTYTLDVGIFKLSRAYALLRNETK